MQLSRDIAPTISSLRMSDCPALDIRPSRSPVNKPVAATKKQDRTPLLSSGFRFGKAHLAPLRRDRDRLIPGLRDADASSLGNAQAPHRLDQSAMSWTHRALVSASAASFFCRFTKGFACWAAISFTSWRGRINSRAPVMCAATRLHHHHRWRLLSHEHAQGLPRQHLAILQPPLIEAA
jgi:hypothetical protein